MGSSCTKELTSSNSSASEMTKVIYYFILPQLAFFLKIGTKVQTCFQFSSLRFNHHQMPRSTSCLFHSAQPTRKLHLFAVTCMSRSLPVFIFCIYCVPIQKLGRSLFILSRTFRFNEIGAKPNRHVGATDLWLVESRSSNKNAHNKPPMGKWYKYCFNFKTDFWLMTKLILFLLIKTITIKRSFHKN